MPEAYKYRNCEEVPGHDGPSIKMIVSVHSVRSRIYKTFRRSLEAEMFRSRRYRWEQVINLEIVISGHS